MGKGTRHVRQDDYFVVAGTEGCRGVRGEMAGAEWNQIRLGLILMDQAAWTSSLGEP